MLPTLAAAFLAGSLSVLSPCVLPLLPVLAGGALQLHRWAPLALATGLAGSFTIVGLFIASLGFSSGVDPDSLRTLAAILLIVFGSIILSSRLQGGFTRVIAPFSSRLEGLAARLPADSLIGQFLLGAVLGVAWSPCAGPSLGAAVGLAAQGGTIPTAAAVMSAFSLGAVIPLLALAYGSRHALQRRRQGFVQMARIGKPLMGFTLLSVGLLIISGADKIVEARITDTMPLWLVTLTTRF